MKLEKKGFNQDTPFGDVEVSDEAAAGLVPPDEVVCEKNFPSEYNVYKRSKKSKKERRLARRKEKAGYEEIFSREPVITVSDLVVRYKSMNTFSIRKQLLSKDKGKRSEVFEALHGISFEVYKGEILGIIGRNGSGKSTLLRAIGGIFSPDEGTVDLHGNEASLLAIGVGFQRPLTGRENIYLSGMLQGHTQEYIDERIDDIIEFSELGQFIDKPVRTYSSGMYSKLAFSIAVTLETDILLIDEVLSVGDAHFKKKSYAKMKSLIRDKDRTVILVSHSTSTLRKLCTRVLWINDGDLVKTGPPSKTLKEYEKFMDGQP